MDLMLNNLQRLICHKTQQTKPNQLFICHMRADSGGSLQRRFYTISKEEYTLFIAVLLKLFVYEYKISESFIFMWVAIDPLFSIFLGNFVFRSASLICLIPPFLCGISCKNNLLFPLHLFVCSCPPII